MLNGVKGILFDKDGTLYDFDATWGPWCAALLGEYAGGDELLKERLAQAIGFDLKTQLFDPVSPVIAGTADVSARLLLPHLADWSFQGLLADINRKAGAVRVAEAVPLRPFLEELRTRGFKLGVATNDSESSTLEQLAASGIQECFEFIAGYDTGYGAKPEPGQLRGFSARTGLEPDEIVMVGDSLADLLAAKRAGMLGIGVLTGPASEAELAPHAVQVLSSIGDLPAILPSV